MRKLPKKQCEQRAVTRKKQAPMQGLVGKMGENITTTLEWSMVVWGNWHVQRTPTSSHETRFVHYSFFCEEKWLRNDWTRSILLVDGYYGSLFEECKFRHQYFFDERSEKQYEYKIWYRYASLVASRFLHTLSPSKFLSKSAVYFCGRYRVFYRSFTKFRHGKWLLSTLICYVRVYLSLFTNVMTWNVTSWTIVFWFWAFPSLEWVVTMRDTQSYGHQMAAKDSSWWS